MKITEVYQIYNPIASSAASLDRVLIKSRRKELMCSVKNKEKIFECLKERNPQIQFSPQSKNDIHLKIEMVNENKLVISGRDQEETKVIYEKLVKRCKR